MDDTYPAADVQRFVASSFRTVEELEQRIAQLESVLRQLLTTNTYVQGKAWQSGECFYCGAPWEEDGDNHAPDCLLMVAERLLDEVPRTPA